MKIKISLVTVWEIPTNIPYCLHMSVATYSSHPKSKSLNTKVGISSEDICNLCFEFANHHHYLAWHNDTTPVSQICSITTNTPGKRNSSILQESKWTTNLKGRLGQSQQMWTYQSSQWSQAWEWIHPNGCRQSSPSQSKHYQRNRRVSWKEQKLQKSASPVEEETQWLKSHQIIGTKSASLCSCKYWYMSGPSAFRGYCTRSLWIKQ